MSTVLVVDDQVSLLHTLEQSLLECGYDVKLATTGGQALKRIEQHAADIVILDLGLPDMGGMEVLTRIRGWSTMPVSCCPRVPPRSRRSPPSTQAQTTTSPSRST
jgi:DNA-binding response OmpR family regulator